MDDEKVWNISIDLISRGKHQPRVFFSEPELRELADSIKVHGVIQPVILRPREGGRFELVAGERRWRATQLAGLHTISAVIRELSDRAALEIAIIENVQREDLRPVEEARSLQRLAVEFDLTHEQVAQRVGWTRASVSQSLRLLNLIEEVQRMVDGTETEGSLLDASHGEILSGLNPDQQRECARLAADNQWTVRFLEDYCRERYLKKRVPSKQAGQTDPDIRRLTEDLSERFGAPVKIKHTKEGGGDLVFHYHSVEELEGILKKINHKN